VLSGDDVMVILPFMIRLWDAGVSWNRRMGQWWAKLRLGGNLLVSSYFDDEEAAARAYDAYVLSLSLWSA
jgi:hypothetical protein